MGRLQLTASSSVETIKTGSPRESLAGGSVKGSILRAHVQWVAEQRSPGDLTDLRDALPGEISHELSSFVLSSTWYPFSWLIGLDRTMIDLFATDESDLLAELGRYSARLDLSPIHRLLNFRNPHEFFRLSAMQHSLLRDFGSAVYEPAGERQGTMVHRHYGCFSPVDCETFIGYYEQAIWSHGPRQAFVEELECQCHGARNCRFQLSWQ
ncbi:MAG TPA: hypothetical protein VMS12_05475 [Thermoanaerobaculia bacterium]|nr:hypothetical protein [Thermoanaerobaculia bacterium]